LPMGSMHACTGCSRGFIMQKIFDNTDSKRIFVGKLFI